MTAQVMDVCEWAGERWCVCALVGPQDALAIPETLGFASRPSSTATLRGYACEYRVDTEGLKLRRLHANLAPESSAFVPAGARRIASAVPAWFDVTFEFDDSPIAVTGTLQLGRELDWDSYVHMGFQAHEYFSMRAFLELEGGLLRDYRIEQGRHPDIERAYDYL